MTKISFLVSCKTIRVIICYDLYKTKTFIKGNNYSL